MRQDKDSAIRKVQTASISGFIRRILADAANAWRLSQRAIVAIVILPFVIALSGVIAAILGKGVYKWYIQEDGPVEDLQVLFWALASIFCILTIRKLWQSGDQWIALLYIGVFIFILFTIGEEISWGQRIFGWVTPSNLEELNRQGETNLHNLRGLEKLLRLAQLLIGAYGTFMPLVALHPSFLRHHRKLIPMIIPHYSLIPYFFLLFAWRVIHNLTPLTKSHPYAADE